MRSRKSKTTQQTLQVTKVTKTDKCSSSVVPAIMLNWDFLSLILEKLHVKQILLCSMVCRSFLRHIDSLNTTYFNNNLRWWSVYGHVEHEDTSLLQYNNLTQQYEQLLTVTQKGAQNWIVNIRSNPGLLVNMRMCLHLPLQHVHMTGSEASIRTITERQFASIDALEWTILSIEDTGISAYVCKGTLGTVNMQVKSFVHNNKLVTLTMQKPIVVTFLNVPIPSVTLAPRILCVLKCINQCMHCQQRFAKWRSVDNVAANHRALCSTCKDELYVDQKQIASKWKILNLPVTVESCYFIQFGFWRQNPRFYSKRDVAVALGHKSWEQMLRNNRLQNKRRKTLLDGFAHFDFSNRYFLY